MFIVENQQQRDEEVAFRRWQNSMGIQYICENHVTGCSWEGE
jgi:hypothetical protein